MGLASHEETIKEHAKKRYNAHFMLIDGMTKVMTNQDKKCQSLDFHAAGLKWSFYIKSDVVKDHLSCYLSIKDEKCIGSNWEVQCSFNLIVVSHTGLADLCKPCAACFTEKNPSWGQASLISNVDLKKNYLVNEKVVFCAEITEVKPKFLNVNSVSPTMGTVERLKLTEVQRKNSRFTWKITQFSSFDGEHHSSYEFTVGPRRWNISMYPKGVAEASGKFLSLFLTATDYVTNGPKAATLAVFRLRVLDQLKRKHRELDEECCWFSSGSTWGTRKALALEELHKASNGFLVNDEIYLGVEFFFVSTTDYL
ncbi:unnamed protein product [Thlaspi arvense]|uniref:MATH domain-containing protein n=1 Tax=Thlaspi arvense TaxID=13288 RepID=A0AAU9S8W0_THLAR|nr:unnamed protein product [Thlaspi arvense]